MRQEFLAKLILVRQHQPDRLPEVLARQIEATEDWVRRLEQDLNQRGAPDAIEDQLVSSFRLLQDRAVLEWLHQTQQALITN
jgi:hypothetical protein